MAVRAKGNKWQVDVSLNGVRAPRVNRDTKAEAQKTEALFKAHLLAGKDPALLAELSAPMVAARGTLGQLIQATYADRWMDTKGEATALTNARAWAIELGSDTPIHTITSEKIADVVNRWTEAGSAAGTINRKLAALSCVLKLAYDREQIDRIPAMTRKREYEGRLRYFEDDEVDSLLDFATRYHQFAPLVLLAVETGMRQGELLGLTRRDVDVDRGLLLLGETKGNKRRSVPLTVAAKEVLPGLMRGKRAHERLFPTNLNKRTISRHMYNWKREIGLPLGDEACFHTLRHTCCSRLVQAGVPLIVVQRWMGHSSIQTTMKYAHLAPDSLDVALAALNKRNGD